MKAKLADTITHKEMRKKNRNCLLQYFSQITTSRPGVEYKTLWIAFFVNSCSLSEHLPCCLAAKLLAVELAV